MLAFVGSHRQYNRLHSENGAVVHFDIFDCLAHTWNHRSQVFDVAHLLDLLQLCEEVVEVKLVLLDFSLKFTSLFFVVLLLRTLYQGNDVAHAEDAVCHT